MHTWCNAQGMADQSCQPGATWQPFVIKATFPHDSPPSVVAVSNYTWCATRSQQTTASRIVSDAVATRSNSKVFRASSREGVQLMLLNAQTRVVAGGLFTLPDEKGEGPSGLLQAQRDPEPSARFSNC